MSEQAIQSVITAGESTEALARPSFGETTRSNEPSSAHDATLSWVIAIAVMAGFLRVGLLMFGPMNDMSWSYTAEAPRNLALATAMAESGSFGLAEEPAGTVHKQVYLLRERLGQLEAPNAKGLIPETYHLPGYPAVLAAFQRMGLPEYSVLAFQAALSALGAMLACIVGMQLVQSKTAGVIAAALFALHPGAISTSNLVTPETLLTVLVLGGLAFAVTVCKGKGLGLGSSIGAGLCLGLAALVQPVALVIGPLVALWTFVADFKLRTLITAIILMVVSLCPAALWVVRNHSVGFGPRYSSEPMVHAWFYTSAYMNIDAHGGDPETEWAGVVNTMVGDLAAGIQPGEDVVDAAGRMSIERIIESPELYLGVLTEGSKRFFMSHSLSEVTHQVGLDETIDARPLEAMIQMFMGGQTPQGHFLTILLGAGWELLNIAMATGMVIGVLFLLVRRQYAAALLIIGASIWFVMGTQFIGEERARLPLLALQAVAIATFFITAPPAVVKAKSERAEKKAQRKLKKKKKKAREIDVEFDDEPVEVTRGPLAAMGAVEPSDAPKDPTMIDLLAPDDDTR